MSCQEAACGSGVRRGCHDRVSLRSARAAHPLLHEVNPPSLMGFPDSGAPLPALSRSYERADVPERAPLGAGSRQGERHDQGAFHEGCDARATIT